MEKPSSLQAFCEVNPPVGQLTKQMVDWVLIWDGMRPSDVTVMGE